MAVEDAPAVLVEAPDDVSYQAAYEWTPVGTVDDLTKALQASGAVTYAEMAGVAWEWFQEYGGPCRVRGDEVSPLRERIAGLEQRLREWDAVAEMVADVADKDRDLLGE